MRSSLLRPVRQGTAGGSHDNDNRRGSMPMTEFSAATARSELPAESAGDLTAIIYVWNTSDAKVLEAALTYAKIRHEIVNDAETFISRMRTLPNPLAVANLAGDPLAAITHLKSDPEIKDRPLLVYSSHGRDPAFHLGGAARSVFNLDYPFGLAAVLEALQRFR